MLHLLSFNESKHPKLWKFNLIHYLIIEVFLIYNAKKYHLYIYIYIVEFKKLETTSQLNSDKSEKHNLL